MSKQRPRKAVPSVHDVWWNTEQVAAHHGYSRQRVVQLAKLRGIGQKLNRAYVFHYPDDVEAMAPKPVGRPKGT